MDEARYLTDPLYKRTVDRERAWGNIARKLEASAYRAAVRAWLTGSQIGDSDSQERYTVTARALGTLTITLADGTRRGMHAPVPIA